MSKVNGNETKGTSPSYRQLYALVATLAELAGLEPPRDRKTASELIERLRLAPKPAAAGDGDIPL